MPFGIMSKHDSRVTAKYNLKEVLGKWVTSHNCLYSVCVLEYGCYTCVHVCYNICMTHSIQTAKRVYVYICVSYASTCWELLIQFGACQSSLPLKLWAHSLLLFTICRGAFSEVYRAIQKDTHKEYAIKVIKKDALKGKEEALQMEVQVLQKLVICSFSSSHIMSTSTCSFRSAVIHVRHTFYKHSWTTWS